MYGQDPLIVSQHSADPAQPSARMSDAVSPAKDSLPPQLPAHLQVPGLAEESPGELEQNYWSNVFHSINQMTLGKSQAYGAPRVFDLFTLLAITLAFAFLFALLNLLSPAIGISAEDLVLAIGTLVVIVGAAQMSLFHANNPRLASFIAGPPALFAVTWYPVYRVINQDLISGMIYAGILSILFGFLAGYLAGGVVAGVFLLADRFRNHYMKPTTIQRDSCFDDVQ